MKLAIISDIHTKSNLDFIISYLEKMPVKIDVIIINGDVLGENEARDGYGYSFNRSIFLASLPKEEILEKLQPGHQLKRLHDAFSKGDREDFEAAETIKSYVKRRYDDIFESLMRLSLIAETHFNVGSYESPMQYNVLKELSFLTDIPEDYIRSLALLTSYREVFQEFQQRFKDPKAKKVKLISGSPVIIGETMIAGIPGFYPNVSEQGKSAEFQEKLTTDLISAMTRNLPLVNKLVLLNQTQGKLRKDPFTFRPASLAVREFMERSKQKLRQKIFVQSYYHMMTTHFYEAAGFHFMLNNAAVNNCLFNILEIGSKIVCYDVDPKKDKILTLKTYNYNLNDYSKPEERLALNYDDPEKIIEERMLSGSYYM
jgi:hypothetical protein